MLPTPCQDCDYWDHKNQTCGDCEKLCDYRIETQLIPEFEESELEIFSFDPLFDLDIGGDND